MFPKFLGFPNNLFWFLVVELQQSDLADIFISVQLVIFTQIARSCNNSSSFSSHLLFDSQDHLITKITILQKSAQKFF